MSTGILGVLGAHGCGKTALVRALTGEETDRLKDETMIDHADILAAPGCLSPSHVLDVDFTCLAGCSEPFRNRTAVRIHLGSAELAGHIVLLEVEELVPPGLLPR